LTKIPLYPLKFEPILKPKVWGGSALKHLFFKEAEGKVGESWELSGVKDNVSVIANGPFTGMDIMALIQKFDADLVGEKVFKQFGNTFPLLFKFIDAHQDLSVQLHPGDALAEKRHNSFGKTEMWYIIAAEENARLILGFNRPMDKENYLHYLSENKLPDILHNESVQPGDVFLIPPGTVHAIGSGVLLAEIQQTSDITYRIYDWDRPDTDGNYRELHTELALEAINYNAPEARIKYTRALDRPVRLCTTSYFEVNKLQVTHDLSRDLSKIDSFTVYMCIEGSAVFETGGFSETIKKGETILIPAIFAEVNIKTQNANFLEVYIP
jgi:mannose-6-phosphate isomerase